MSMSGSGVEDLTDWSCSSMRRKRFLPDDLVGRSIDRMSCGDISAEVNRERNLLADRSVEID